MSVAEREDGWDDPADEGWGGTADEAWGSGPPATPVYGTPPPGQPAYPTPAPTTPQPGYPTSPNPPSGYPTAPGYPPPPPPPPRRGRNKGWLYGGGGAVVIAVVVAVVLLASSGGGKKKPNPSPAPSVSASASASASVSPQPSTSPSPSPTLSAPAGTGLAAIAPFTGCTNAPSAEFNTPKVTEQIVCTGTAVTSKVPALGVSYAKFPTTADLNAWYQTTILSSNGIKPNQGTCANGSLVNTTRGAQYCEGAFTDDTGSTARQVLVEAPSTIKLTNGPNSTNANCPGSSFTLLVFTSPSDNVGVVALGCPASPVTAKAFETSLNNGDFDLND
jgi:hypothetical protein